MLYDGGRPSEVALEYLRNVGVTRLDLVIASHTDADHVGGLEAVVEAYRPRFYIDNDVVADSDVYQELTASVRALKIAELEPTARRIGLGAASLQIIPPRIAVYKRLEATCRAAKVKFKGVHALRHACRTRLHDETGDLALVADHLRHNSLDTARGYAKASNQQLKKAVGDW